MYKWLILGVTLWLLCWSFSEPVTAASWFIAFCALIDVWLIALQKTQRPKSLEPGTAPHFLTPDEVQVVLEYPLLFKYPLTAYSIFSGLNYLQLASGIWVIWLVYSGHWPLAIPIAINFMIASKLGVMLEPRPWHTRIANGNRGDASSISQVYLETIQSVFEKTYGKK